MIYTITYRHNNAMYEVDIRAGCEDAAIEKFYIKRDYPTYKIIKICIAKPAIANFQPVQPPPLVQRKSLNWGVNFLV
jgi:hypothetical protein